LPLLSTSWTDLAAAAAAMCLWWCRDGQTLPLVFMFLLVRWPPHCPPGWTRPPAIGAPHGGPMVHLVHRWIN
jgi:hypothetical protein